MSETPEAIIARALNQMGGRAGFCNELAGAIIAALDVAGYAVVPKDATYRGGPELAQIRALPPGTIFRVSDLSGADRKAIYNAAAYAARKGEVKKIGRGRYEITASHKP